ncbi:hypothetical protein [Butyrivibrio sp. M55]|uniref:hypothetical protein n=1 Tax=Butyrivibrio sp. M55 TaxID=1855323 RepID=UPI0008DFD171|nr:hypothetical protein [Butyrivibrio sp. M55]SFU91146.1 hypothetical protein SAMN05216540_12041 [Butyrivibrio sp. M55]
MAKANKDISRIEEQMKDNAILDVWTNIWGLKVYTVYPIDKLRFSFIEKGANGKGKSFDIYMDCLRDGTQCFDNWAYDILHGRMQRILADEKQNGEEYPKAFKYTTGENAEKSIGIMNSRNGGYCINGSVPGDGNKKLFCNIPISEHDLRRIAERYTISYQKRKDELEQMREKAAKEQSNWRNNHNNNEANTSIEQKNAQSTQAETKQPSNVVGINKVKAKFKVKAEAPLTDDKGGWKTLKVLDASGRERTVAFGPKAIEKTGSTWNQFLNHLNSHPFAEFTISAEEENQYLKFIAF